MKRVLTVIVIVFILCGLAALAIDGYVRRVASPYILDAESAPASDCILVLGCRVHENSRPSNMLADRLRRGVELYESGVAPKLLMSGDHGQHEYNEVQVMKQYAIDEGVPSKDVFMDHAGFSTYDSLFRARDVFDVKKVVIVTQEYHLYRAVYIARSLGLDAYGVSSDYHTYAGQTLRDIREVAARVKDYLSVIFRPNPKFLGEVISIQGDGNVTNDT